MVEVYLRPGTDYICHRVPTELTDIVLSELTDREASYLLIGKPPIAFEDDGRYKVYLPESYSVCTLSAVKGLVRELIEQVYPLEFTNDRRVDIHLGNPIADALDNPSVA